MIGKLTSEACGLSSCAMFLCQSWRPFSPAPGVPAPGATGLGGIDPVASREIASNLLHGLRYPDPSGQRTASPSHHSPILIISPTRGTSSICTCSSGERRPAIATDFRGMSVAGRGRSLSPVHLQSGVKLDGEPLWLLETSNFRKESPHRAWRLPKLDCPGTRGDEHHSWPAL